MKACVSDRFIEAREPLKVLYKDILVASFDIWCSQFARLQASEIAEDDASLHTLVRQRWLSSRANNTMVSVLCETIDEADINAVEDEEEEEEDEERNILIRRTRASTSRQK